MILIFPLSSSATEMLIQISQAGLAEWKLALTLQGDPDR